MVVTGRAPAAGSVVSAAGDTVSAAELSGVLPSAAGVEVEDVPGEQDSESKHARARTAVRHAIRPVASFRERNERENGESARNGRRQLRVDAV